MSLEPSSLHPSLPSHPHSPPFLIFFSFFDSSIFHEKERRAQPATIWSVAHGTGRSLGRCEVVLDDAANTSG
ncbi:unnamed protein product [Gadus morhua 'NCC']